MAADVLRLSYDYGELEEGARREIEQRTIAIKLRMRRTAEDIIAIGQDLIAVKERLPHGRFGPWLETEFGLSGGTARAFMKVAEKFSSKSSTVADLPVRTLLLLAQDNQDELRKTVQARAEAGEAITNADVQALKREFAAERRKLKDKLETADARRQDAQRQETRLREEMAVLRRRYEALEMRLDRVWAGAETDAEAPPAEPDAEAPPAESERETGAPHIAVERRAAGPDLRQACRRAVREAEMVRASQAAGTEAPAPESVERRRWRREARELFQRAPDAEVVVELVGWLASQGYPPPGWVRAVPASDNPPDIPAFLRRQKRSETAA